MEKCRQPRMTDLFSNAPEAKSTPEAKSARPPPSKSYPIGGVVVKFPYKPYPVQVGVLCQLVGMRDGKSLCVTDRSDSMCVTVTVGFWCDLMFVTFLTLC